MSGTESPASPDAWRVYLLECADGTLYCGVTTNMDRRMAQHNGLLGGGAKYTRARRPVRLLASRGCADRSEALRLEARVRRYPRAEKVRVLTDADRSTASVPHGGV